MYMYISTLAGFSRLSCSNLEEEPVSDRAPAQQSAPAAPRRRDPAARRRQILDAAAELVVELGPAALTHRAIAKRAGVPLGSTTQHFTSIDELREAALQQLSEEIDEALARIEPVVEDLLQDPSLVVTEILSYLQDPRVVHADIALMMSGTTDPRLRALALRWNDRLIEILSEPLGRERAEAISVYLDGATIHAGLHDEPLSRESITAAIVALTRIPDPGEPSRIAATARDAHSAAAHRPAQS